MMRMLEEAMRDRKKFYIQVTAIAVCLVGAVLGYIWMSGGSEPPNAKLAEQRSEEIDKAVKAGETEPPPPDISRAPKRGRVEYPGTK